MPSKWKLDELITLLRRRYPDWTGFDHPRFVADEIEAKQATAAKAHHLLNQAELERLLETVAYGEIISRLDTLGKDNNLLWRRAPKVGDMGILYQPHLDHPAFCHQVHLLLYGPQPSPERLQAFADFATTNNLPNKWTFPTYLLFICWPGEEMFVKPRTAAWFLKFMGAAEELPTRPTAAAYNLILENAQALLTSLESYRPQDMIDMQSFIWVCARESQQRTGRLDLKGQIDLDVPPTIPSPATLHYQNVAYGRLLRETAPPTSTAPANLAELAHETGFAEAELADWLLALERKGQAILYGPPGTGKTHMAERLAHYLVGHDDGFYDLVQFHPAYAYEDFIQGIRPQSRPDGGLNYTLVPGRFLEFCREAETRNGRCVLIIDEINRANLARVFGELMYLLEYREQEVALAGGGSLSIPKNVYLIGTMNTADRSIALVDHALRRRFAFIPLPPNYDILRRYHEERQTGFATKNFVDLLQRLNAQIGDTHYHIGITFFLHPQLAAQLPNIWRTEIEPYLEEYFFDQPERLEAFRWERVKGIVS